MSDSFEFVLDKEQPMPTREEAIEEQKRLLRWALNDSAFFSAIVAEERLKFEQKYAHWKELEKAEAEGRLVVLPCKVGDQVWAVGERRIIECEIDEVVLGRKGQTSMVSYKCDDDCGGCPFNSWHQDYSGEYSCGGEWGEASITSEAFGKTVFRTREEAEAKLKNENPKN